MNKLYDVFSCHHQSVPVDAVLKDGTVVSAMVDSVQVQLTPEDGVGGTCQVVFQGAETIAAADAMFVVGAKITVTFSGE